MEGGGSFLSNCKVDFVVAETVYPVGVIANAKAELSLQCGCVLLHICALQRQIISLLIVLARIRFLMTLLLSVQQQH